MGKFDSVGRSYNSDTLSKGPVLLLHYRIVLLCFGLFFSFDGAAVAVDLVAARSAVKNFRLGPFEVYVERQPLRYSVHFRNQPVISQTARRRGSLQGLTESGWHAAATLGVVELLERESDRLTLSVSATGAGDLRMQLEFSWERGTRTLVARSRLLGVAVQAVRDDFVLFPDEVWFGVDTRPLDEPAANGPPLRRWGVSTRWLVSSRGHALRVQGTGSSPVRIFTPNPDTYRIQTRGEVLEWRLVVDQPKAVLGFGAVRTAPVKADALWIRVRSEPTANGLRSLERRFREFQLPKPILAIETDGEGTITSPGNDPKVCLYGDWSADTLGSWASTTARFRVVETWVDWRRAAAASLEAHLDGVPVQISFESRLIDRDPKLGECLAIFAAFQSRICLEASDDPRGIVSPNAARTVRRALELRESLLRFRSALASRSPDAEILWGSPLLVQFPGDSELWRIRDQWLYGPDLMAAPTMRSGQAERTVYFPEGEWFDVGQDGSTRTYHGPKRYRVDVDLIGLFERRGAQIRLREFFPSGLGFRAVRSQRSR